jgi:hypothetical protein
LRIRKMDLVRGFWRKIRIWIRGRNLENYGGAAWLLSFHCVRYSPGPGLRAAELSRPWVGWFQGVDSMCLPAAFPCRRAAPRSAVHRSDRFCHRGFPGGLSCRGGRLHPWRTPSAPVGCASIPSGVVAEEDSAPSDRRRFRCRSKRPKSAVGGCINKPHRFLRFARQQIQGFV